MPVGGDLQITRFTCSGGVVCALSEFAGIRTQRLRKNVIGMDCRGCHESDYPSSDPYYESNGYQSQGRAVFLKSANADLLVEVWRCVADFGILEADGTEFFNEK